MWLINLHIYEDSTTFSWNFIRDFVVFVYSAKSYLLAFTKYVIILWEIKISSVIWA